ncbi:MAG TPA: tRNA isopentenyl-2-thiomethyl-A-37 hydroxylase MiaE [Steroidobacteraceae bacterium]|nr:tRNA isopentenyl-2-thiomethyl-A-37 hydroxylase MiaE [Steroidobacteraceae bacterium]
MILAAATPPAWVDAAIEHWQDLLQDHANCEKKAASTAVALLFAYPDDQQLARSVARLAREELRHFEQVDRLMQQLGVQPKKLSPGRYAGELRRALATLEPQRKLDLMLCGALIEARSCERFELLAPQLAAPLSAFYADLAVAERRHHELYLQLARNAAAELKLDDEATAALLAARLQALAAVEADLATRPDTQFRFHSGPPTGPSAGASVRAA